MSAGISAGGMQPGVLRLDAALKSIGMTARNDSNATIDQPIPAMTVLKL